MQIRKVCLRTHVWTSRSVFLFVVRADVDPVHVSAVVTMKVLL
jgi:hypothetical protein